MGKFIWNCVYQADLIVMPNHLFFHSIEFITSQNNGINNKYKENLCSRKDKIYSFFIFQMFYGLEKSML